MCSDNEVQRHVVRSIAAFLESVPRELCYHHLVKVSHLVLSFRFWKSNQVQLFIPFSFYSCLESYFQFFFLSLELHYPITVKVLDWNWTCRNEDLFLHKH